MSNLSLNASLRTCRVQAGEAARIQSDRFQNPNNMVCIPWNGYNNKGQQVCADSWYTKTPGCRSALDRVAVESYLRPDYSSYIQLDAGAIAGDIYGNPTAASKSKSANEWLEHRNDISGQYGQQWQSSNIKSCGGGYEAAMAQAQQADREASYANNSYKSNQYREASNSY